MFSLKKGGRRDGWQLLSNVGPSLFFYLLYTTTKNSDLLVASFACLAVVFADTMASEIGLFSRGTTFTLTGKKIARGLSGGVSLLGLGAALSSTLIFSIWLLILQLLFTQPVALWPAPYYFWLILAGFCGQLFDSVLGLAQGKFLTNGGTITEKKTSHKLTGLTHLTNDGVNFISNGLTGLAVFAMLTLT